MTAVHDTKLTDLSAAEMAARVARAELSSVELVQAHLERIAQVNPALNAVVVERREQALAEARQADQARQRGAALGPLHGVPVTVKECLDLTGTPSTFGLHSHATLRVEHDDAYVAQLRAAGAIVVGKTNVAQCLLYAESDNPVYGRTANPWNPARSCGGSSGGEGAIIAARGSPLGLGNDIGGSVRTPAAFCGVAGFKPTSGRTPDAGRYGLPIGQRAVVSQVGLLARHVGDLALGLNVLNRVNSEPACALGDPGAVDVSRLRIAVYTDDGSFHVSPAVARATRRAAELLRQRGAAVFDWTPPAVPHAVHLFYALLTGDGGQALRRMLKGERIDPRVRALLLLTGMPRPLRTALRGALRLAGQDVLAEFLAGFGHTRVDQHWTLVAEQLDYQQRFARALHSERIDAIVCPPFALPAYTHGASQDLGVAGGYGILWNVLGYPAGVVPVGRVHAGEEIGRAPARCLVNRAALKVEQGSAGLPVGVQVVARPWREHVALAVMQTIEDLVRHDADYPHRPPLP